MEPELRAALLKMYLERLRSLGDDHAAAIRLDVDPAILRQVEGAPMSGWLPLALEVEILQAVERRRGEDGVRELGRVLGRVAVESPVFRPLVAATFAMLGRLPEALVWLAMQGWEIATRHAGLPSYRRVGPRLAHGVLDDLPPVCRNRAHLVRTCGAIEGLFDSAGRTAAVELEWEAGAERAVFAVSWR